MIRVLAIACCVALIAWIDPLADKVNEGNRLYAKELNDEAMTKYTEALIDSPNSPHIHLNIGNAAYKKEDYDEAIKSYAKAASLAGDMMLESKAYYNLGNCKYRQGRLKENTDLGEAISLYREALEYYKQALNENPRDTSAKYNHEFVERKMKELLDKQKQEGEEDKQEQQEKQDQESQPQEGDEDKGEDEENAEQNEAQADQEGQEQESQNEDQASEQREELTAEEAKMLLDSLRDEELSELRKSEDRSSFPRVTKDW